jgi:ABC-2 type transport system permease protein
VTAAAPFAVSCRKEWLEQWRTHRLLVLVVVLTLFGLLAPFTAKYTPELLKLLPNGAAMARLLPAPTSRDAVAQYLKSVSQFGFVLALLLTMGAVSQEKDKGTAALLLVKPLPRRTFLRAKFATLAAAFALATTAAALGGYYYTWLLFGSMPLAGWLVLNGLILVFLLVQIAVTLLFSVIAKSQAAAGGMAFAVLIALALLGSIPVIGGWMPARLLAWGGSAISGQPLTAWPALAVSLGLVVVSLGLAQIIFERQEL